LKELRKGVTKDLTGGTSQENDVALGTGEIDIPGILREANKVGIKHFFIEGRKQSCEYAGTPEYCVPKKFEEVEFKI
jgi:hypothetical protein